MPLVSGDMSEQLVCVMLTIAGSAGVLSNKWVDKHINKELTDPFIFS